MLDLSEGGKGEESRIHPAQTRNQYHPLLLP